MGKKRGDAASGGRKERNSWSFSAAVVVTYNQAVWLGVEVSSSTKTTPDIKEELKETVLASSDLLKKPFFFGLLQQAIPCQYSTTQIKWYRNIIEQKTGDNLQTSPSPRRAFLSCQMTVQSCLRAITVVFASEKYAYLYRIHWALGMAEASTSRKRRLDIIWDQI